MNAETRGERPGLASIAWLVATLCLAAVLRIENLGSSSLWLDEILSYDIATAAAKQPLWRWLIAPEPEHGPLFHASLLAGRLLPSIEWSARIGSALIGTLTIVAGWFAARAANARVGTASVFALLLAMAPLHVYYSREGRPYALLMFLSTAALAMLLRRDSPGWMAIVGVAAVYASAAAVPFLMSVAIAAVGASVASTNAIGAAYRRTAFLVAASILLVPLLYARHPNVSRQQFPQVNAHFLDAILQSFSVATLSTSERSRAAYALLLFAVIGAVALFRRGRAGGWIVTALAVLPVVLGCVALWALGHWYAVRYISPALPPYLLLVCAGVSSVAHQIASRLFRRHARREAAGIALALGIAVTIGWKELPAARTETYQKLDWRLVASTLWHHGAPGDVVMTTNDWSAVSLGFYLRQLPARLRLINARESVATAENVTARTTPVWIVSAGFHRQSEIREWVCRFPVVLASPLESFSLHYAPSMAHLLEYRTSAAEWRALDAGFAGRPFTLTFGADDEIFLADGWAGVERVEGADVRWATGRRASVLVPIDTAADHRIVIRMMPLAARGLPPQAAAIYADNRLLTELVLLPGWHQYAIDAQSGIWQHDGSPTITFAFSRANQPSALDPASSDHRFLSAMFDRLTIDPAPASSEQGGPAMFAVRLQELDERGRPRYLDQNATGRNHRTRFDPARMNRDALAALAGRCGFDPRTAVAAFLDRSLTIEQLADSLLDRSACLDDASFVRATYWALLGRSITAEEGKRISSPWRGAKERGRLVHGLIESSEFAERMFRMPGDKAE